jgi:pseudouridine synthase
LIPSGRKFVKRVYYALNKPMDVVCTNFDPSGRTRVIDLVPNDERVFAVGRLDRASEGLILLTNDGQFANHLTHPRYGVEKTYLVRVAGRPGPEELAKLRRGVHLAEGFCKVESVAVKSRHKQSSDLLIVLDEGRNREIRRILAKVGHKVLRLKRISIGNLKLGPLEPGEWRKLAAEEIEGLMAISRKKKAKKKAPPPPREPAEPVVDEAPKRAPRLPVERAESPAAQPKPVKKPPKASEIAARLLAGKNFEDEDEDDDEDFAEELLSGDLAHGEDDELSDDADDEWGAGSLDDDDDDDDGEIQARVIREEVKDTTRPPRSGPAPRGEVIDFDEDSPPPLQPKKVREPRGVTKSPRPRREQGKRTSAEDRPLRAEPRTGHRRRGDESRVGQSTRRGQRHRTAEEAQTQRPGRPDRPGQGGRPVKGARDDKDAAAPLPRRPGKLVPARPQEERGARGKYPGKSFGKGKKHEGGSRGPKNIFGKRIGKKKSRRQP